MSEEQTPVEPPVETPAQPVEAPVENTRWVNDDGTWNTGKFADGLGEHTILQKYKTPDDLVKAAINKDEFLGKKVDEWISSDDPNIAAMRAKALGVPDDPTAYSFEYPESFTGLPDDSQSAIKQYFNDSAQWATENGVPADLYKKFAERDLDRAITLYNEQATAASAQAMEAEEAVKQAWGSKYDYNLAKTEDTLATLGSERLAEYVKNDPLLRKELFETVTPTFENDTLIQARQEQSFATLEDQRAELSGKMRGFDGPTSSHEYKQMQKDMEGILMKMTGKA